MEWAKEFEIQNKTKFGSYVANFSIRKEQKNPIYKNNNNNKGRDGSLFTRSTRQIKTQIIKEHKNQEMTNTLTKQKIAN